MDTKPLLNPQPGKLPASFFGGGGMLPPPNLGGGGSAPSTGGGEDPMAQAQQMSQQRTQVTAPYLQQMNQDIGQERQIAGSFDGSPAPQPQFQDMPQAPKDNFLPTMNVFGSLGSVVALLGSLQTRSPMTAALNSAAKMMEGYHKGDQEVIAQNRQKWLDSTEQAVKHNQMEVDKFNSIMQNKDLSMKAKQAQLAAFAHSIGDTNTAAAVAVGNLEPVYEIMKTRAQASVELNKLMVMGKVMGGDSGGSGGGVQTPEDNTGLPNNELHLGIENATPGAQTPMQRGTQMAQVNKDNRKALMASGQVADAARGAMNSADRAITLASELKTGLATRAIAKAGPGFDARIDELRKLNLIGAMDAMKPGMASRFGARMEQLMAQATYSPDAALDANLNVANAIKLGAQNKIDEHTFKTWYASKGGSVTDADGDWQRYQSNVPYISEKGQMVEANPNYVNYKTYFPLESASRQSGWDVQNAIKFYKAASEKGQKLDDIIKAIQQVRQE